MKNLISLILLIPLLSFGQDTIYVKNVFVNGKQVKVKKGYIIHKGVGNWVVNGRKVKFYGYKPTEDSKFKPDSSHTTGNACAPFKIYSNDEQRTTDYVRNKIIKRDEGFKVKLCQIKDKGFD